MNRSTGVRAPLSYLSLWNGDPSIFLISGLTNSDFSVKEIGIADVSRSLPKKEFECVCVSTYQAVYVYVYKRHCLHGQNISIICVHGFHMHKNTTLIYGRAFFGSSVFSIYDCR